MVMNVLDICDFIFSVYILAVHRNLSVTEAVVSKLLWAGKNLFS